MRELLASAVCGGLYVQLAAELTLAMNGGPASGCHPIETFGAAPNSIARDS